MPGKHMKSYIRAALGDIDLDTIRTQANRKAQARKERQRRDRMRRAQAAKK